MGTKKVETVETENKPKKSGRPKVSEGGVSTPKLSLEKEKKKPLKAIYDEDGEILSLDEIKAKLLKKAKAAGSIDQSDIYDTLSPFDVDDNTLLDLINFFKDSGIEVVVDTEEEDEDFEVDFDENKLALDGEDDAADFFEEDTVKEEEEEEIEVDYLGSEVKVNDSVKMYLKEIGKYSLLKATDEPISLRKF